MQRRVQMLVLENSISAVVCAMEINIIIPIQMHAMVCRLLSPINSYLQCYFEIVLQNVQVDTWSIAPLLQIAGNAGNT